MNRPGPLLLALVLTFLLAGAASAQRRPAPGAGSEEPDPASLPRETPTWRHELWRPRHAVEVAFSDRSLWAAYRGHLEGSTGFLTAGFLTNEDDDWAAVLRLMRFGEPAPDVPVGLGVGIGLVGVGLETENATVGGLTLTGQADLVLEAHYPMRFLVETSWAPGVSTFGDGEALFDLGLRWEVELSPWAAGYLGYRRFEVELDDGSVSNVDSRLHVGVRLGL